MRRGRAGLRRGARRPLRRLGSAVDGLAAGEPADVHGVGGAAEVRAISDRLHGLAAAIAELTAQATTDPLTGVANRRSFYASLEAELKRAERTAAPVTLVLIDLDGFKEINDTHGHPFGDGVLQTIAEKVRLSLRATDVLARVGGDEFAILLPATPRDARRDADRPRTRGGDGVGGRGLAHLVRRRGDVPDRRTRRHHARRVRRRRALLRQVERPLEHLQLRPRDRAGARRPAATWLRCRPCSTSRTAWCRCSSRSCR